MMEDEKWLSDILCKIPNTTKRDLVAGLALVGNAYLAYEEQQRAQEEQRKQNEDIQAIRSMLEEMQEEQKNQMENIRQEQKRQIESIRQERKRQIENMQQERQRETEEIERERKAWETDQASYKECLKALKKQLEEKDQIIQNKETQLTELENRFQHSENESRAAMQKLEQERKIALASAKEEYQEIQLDWALYKRYKTWIIRNSSKIHLNCLDCSKFESFISCCSKKIVLRYIFQELASVELWDWPHEDIAILDEVIDCCCILQSFDRVEPEGPYDAAYHYKRENAPSNGHIVNTLLRGVCANGNILEDCKSFVELGIG